VTILNQPIQLRLKPQVLGGHRVNPVAQVLRVFVIALVQNANISLYQGNLFFDIRVAENHCDCNADHADDQADVDLFFQVPALSLAAVYVLVTHARNSLLVSNYFIQPKSKSPR